VEVRWSSSAENDPEAIVGGYGSYRQVVRFDAEGGEPTSVLTHRAGSQGIFTERWRGVELLPAPEEVVRRLSKRDAGGRLPDDRA
jgi:hypothetical protein